MKRIENCGSYLLFSQPPSGGCVLKRNRDYIIPHDILQPPSGGCVLKLIIVVPLTTIGASRLRAAVC